MENKKTCLYDKHVALGALMSPFAGFDMPIQYSDIATEHHAVRRECGVFDVSHMGEVTVSGPDAERYVSHIFTGDISGAPVGKVFYGMMCYDDGGTVDDLLVYKLADDRFFLVINASNIDKGIVEPLINTPLNRESLLSRLPESLDHIVMNLRRDELAAILLTADTTAAHDESSLQKTENQQTR